MVNKLREASLENTPPLFSLDGSFKECKVIEVTDGDTIVIATEVEGKICRQRCRLLGINTPELHGEEKEKGLKAKNFVIDLLLYKNVWIKFGKFDSFGRVLGTVYLGKNRKISLNEILVKEGLAIPYKRKKGKSKKPEKKRSSFCCGLCL